MPSVSEQIKMLTAVGTALTSQHDLNKLLDLIVREARALTHADAGSLYIKDGDQLNFTVSQNETLEQRMLSKGKVMEKFKPFPLPISNQSIAGFSANNAAILNIPDVSCIPPDKPYQHNTSFDKKNDYRTCSMLVIPLIDQRDEVIGVLQLINAQRSTDKGVEVIPFAGLMVEMIKSLSSQAAVAITNARLTAQLKKAYLDTIYRLSVAAEYKDQDTAQHIKRMSLYSKIIAEKSGMDERQTELVLYASPMHDIGKLGVPDAILLKPGRLDTEERKVMENHTVYGANILEGSNAEILELSRVIAISHHEKWDGSGYPHRLAGEDIPLTGRIVALADVFDALTSRRPYKEPWSVKQALAEIRKDSGKHFDPQLVECFMDCRDEVREVYREHQEPDSISD